MSEHDGNGSSSLCWPKEHVLLRYFCMRCWLTSQQPPLRTCLCAHMKATLFSASPKPHLNALGYWLWFVAERCSILLAHVFLTHSWPSRPLCRCADVCASFFQIFLVLFSSSYFKHFIINQMVSFTFFFLLCMF